ncbi:MAG TPA: L,D-transpeptidase family protein [Stellaceae bacterium]|jgi:murein L,D-transpeptidase YcbB/YkuD|nr:L,D-transpeptidase family protein [Stellaceae bacterium]
MTGGRVFTRWGRILALLGVLVTAGAAPGLAADPPAPPDSAALAAALQGSDPLTFAGRSLDKTSLAALYQPLGFQPVWTELREQSYLRALEDAESHGLDALSYAVTATQPLARELLLTDSFLRYAGALAHGRVSPQSFETDWRIDPPPFDDAKVFSAAMDGDISTVLAALAPHQPGYERLRGALRQYTALAQAPWHVLFSPVTIQQGDHADIVTELRDRLIAENYLDASQPVDDPTLFDSALAAAVSRFQTTHGLPVDGSIGRLTLAALNVSPALRARQIRWNLERWRSLPRIDMPTRIEVNVAAETATLYQDDQPARAMRVIVGASIHPTPVLRARIQSVLLNPPWVVPASIIEKEIRPMLKRDPNYLQRFGFAYQDVQGGHELIQVPGPTNSLGQVKFEMPNPDDIYMHDTPERRLFALSRRFISHGCVRVEDPRELARILLDSDQWSRDAIDAAIAAGATQSVPLHKALPVYVLYWTAFVDPDGTVEFRDDAYGRDRRLAEALAARAAAEHMAATEDKGTSG